MRKRIGSLLLALILAANLSAWAAADSITQLDPAPTTPTDDPFPTVQSSIAFMYHGVRRSHVGDATTGATAGDGARFAWDANQNGRVGAITLNADGTWSYRMDNDSSTLKTLQPGETITERFTYVQRHEKAGDRPPARPEAIYAPIKICLRVIPET